MNNPFRCKSKINLAIKQLRMASIRIEKGKLNNAESDMANSIINIGKAIRCLENHPLKSSFSRKKACK